MLKVIYISGTGKSGSTLLGKLLGQIDGFVDVGELINIDTQFDHDAKCGCGVNARQCEFWGRVVDSALGSVDLLNRPRWHRLKTRYIPLLLLPGSKRRLASYFKQLHRLHMAISDVSGSGVTVDSSKSVFYGAVLGLFPDIEVYTVHLVRDVRASEGSMYRLKTEGMGKFARRNTWWNSVRWMAVNFLAESVPKISGTRYLRVRYEDLINHPEVTLRQISDMVNEAFSGDFIDGSNADLKKTHTLAGSRVRFKEGSLELKLDERWKEKLPLKNLEIVDFLTKRFRGRYGY